MEQENKRVAEFQITWQERRLWVDVYKDFYRVSLPDGRELRMWRDKEEWKSFPELTATAELGRLVDSREKELN